MNPNARLLDDCSKATAKAVVEIFRWDREEQLHEAWAAVVPVVRAGIVAYLEFAARERKRLLGRTGEEN